MANRTQAERIAASEKSMFEASVKLIVEGGVSALSMHKVGSLAGYSTGVVVHHYKNKKELMKVIVQKVLHIWDKNSAIDHDESDCAIDDLNSLAEIYVENVRRKDPLMIAYFRLMQASHSSYKEIQPEFVKYDEKVRNKIVSIITKGQEKKTIKDDILPMSFATTYVGILRGIALQFFINEDEQLLLSALDTAKQLWEDYISNSTSH